MNKSSVKEIEERFDRDVERFSHLDTGQSSTIDAKISLELITEVASRLCPRATQLLDIGCGAGNYTLMMLSKIKDLNCTLVDISRPMLDKAFERVSPTTNGQVDVIQDDIRTARLKENHFDIVLAGAVLHHLRDVNDWEVTFRKIFRLLKPGGCFMISDFISQDNLIVNELMWENYGRYLETLGGSEYRRKVLDYVEKEDSPRSFNFQMKLLEKCGFSQVELLHKHSCFAAFGAIRQ
jgi:tRNA (cmo5U34)-methyltransferase